MSSVNSFDLLFFLSTIQLSFVSGKVTEFTLQKLFIKYVIMTCRVTRFTSFCFSRPQIRQSYKPSSKSNPDAAFCYTVKLNMKVFEQPDCLYQMPVSCSMNYACTIIN